MKWKTFKTIVEQINQVITNETDITISAEEIERNTVEIFTDNVEYPLICIHDGENYNGKKYISISVEKKIYEE